MKGEKLKIEQVSVKTMKTESEYRDSTPLVDPDSIKSDRVIVRT